MIRALGTFQGGKASPDWLRAASVGLPGVPGSGSSFLENRNLGLVSPIASLQPVMEAAWLWLTQFPHLELYPSETPHEDMLCLTLKKVFIFSSECSSSEHAGELTRCPEKNTQV